MRQYLKPEEVHAPSAAMMQEKKELRQDSKVCLHQGLVIAICQMFNDFSQLRKSVLTRRREEGLETKRRRSQFEVWREAAELEGEYV